MPARRAAARDSWAARATRLTPRSSPPDLRLTVGRWSRTRRPLTPCWSTPAGSSRRPRRTRSTPCWMPPAKGRKVVAVGAWPSGTATSSLPRCRRPTPSWGSTRTDRSAPTSTRCCAANVHRSHAPRDRRTLLPITPVDRHSRRRRAARWTPRVVRRGCCAAGSAPARSPRSSSPADAIGAARSAPSHPSAAPSSPVRRTRSSPRPSWLARSGVRELVLVSENSTSYGKDLGDPRLLERLLPTSPRPTASSASGLPICSRPRRVRR